ncbi:nuclear transport factor 2 family protein [Novosphingobium sp. FSY-8]|uniref:Nuclear transport factor 2 family protein n=1 Tax=Novosphingobium ovatum TaxID=1908523 RepID=A0ABW9XHR1_9SPHN|nr:nuclear transport factor 2 family protein [Novosphingobium ovatum]NBC38083.1 nuclear transport factor 2 family protein [Novosphingobium ovatum]
MTPDQIIEFVDKLYALSGTGQWDAIAELVTDDFFITEAAGLPMEGRFEGKHALRDLFIQVMGSLDVVGLDRVVTTAGGDYGVTLLSLRFADPSLPPAEIAEVFRFRDGKLAEIKPYYFDPAPVIAAAKAKA